MGIIFDKGSKEDDKKEGILKRLDDITDANEKQLQTMKDEHLKLVKRIKEKKSRIKDLRYQINKDNKEQLNYFKGLVKGADATRMKIIERVKKCFRMKDILDLNVLWNFQVMWTCISSIIYKMKK